MKKYLLTLGATALTVTGFAQGAFSGKNLGGNAVNGEDGTALSKLVGKVELLDGSTVLASGSLVKDGFFALGTITDSVATTATATITVNVWDSSVGSTFAAAKAAGHGYLSLNVAGVSLATGTTPPISLVDAGFAGGSLAKGTSSVPEPSTYALAALGLGGLLFISRRK